MAEGSKVGAGAELAEIRATIADTESLRGTWPESRVDTILASLRAKEAELVSGAVVVGGGAVGQAAKDGMAIVSGASGISTSGPVYVIDKVIIENFVTTVAGPSPPPALEAAMESYLRYLIDRYSPLDFRGMGVGDKLPLGIPLAEVYVPLRVRPKMPEGDTLARSLRVAGRFATDAEIESMGERVGQPVDALELLRKAPGLVVLGDPGAGKSTFLKYLALSLARGEGERLGLGVRLPVLLPLAAYAERLSGSKGITLTACLSEFLTERGVEGPTADLLAAGFRSGRLLVLFDGLDEVADATLKHRVVSEVQDLYSRHRAAGCKFVLTSRIVGYRDLAFAAEGLSEATLLDFDDEDIEAFVGRWTAAVEKLASGAGKVAAWEAERERLGLLAAIEGNPGIRRLAANPLLLTILAVMKRQEVELPERRAELYEAYVKSLLNQWNQARSLSGLPCKALHVKDTLRVLAPLALWMQETSPGVGQVEERDLMAELERIFRGEGEGDPRSAAESFLDDVRRESSLLLDQGGHKFGFIHLTFQEYLAAVALVALAPLDVTPLIEALAPHVGDEQESSWHEVALLAIGLLSNRHEQAAGAAIDELLARRPGDPGAAEVLAGRAVIDAGHRGVPQAVRARVVTALFETLRDDARVPAPRRVEAGEVLAQLGDPRSEVMTLAGMEFCQVPAGPFLMGSRKGEKDSFEEEYEQHEVDLAYDYAIGRYPVTVAQFAEFVERSGHRVWDEDALSGPANAPVNWVRWPEALSFCRWLTETWKEEKRITEGWEVRLPSEAEWEKAARGGLEVPSSVGFFPVGSWPETSTLELNPEPARVYPWRGIFDANLGNSGETGIGRQSAVGCFPGGASPYGTEELSGNVWEWTQSIFAADYGAPPTKYPYVAGDGREDLDSPALRVLRGGAFGYVPWSVRCAVRYRDEPSARFIVIGFRVVVSPFPL